MTLSQTRYRVSLLSVAACVAMAISICACRHGDAESADGGVVMSWASLQSRLKESVDHLDLKNPFAGSTVYQDILKNGNLPLYRAMCVTTDYPLVKLAGFCAIRERFPSYAFEAAIRSLATTDRPMAPFYEPIRDFIGELTLDVDHVDVLKRAFLSTPVPMDNASAILLYLDVPLLVKKLDPVTIRSMDPVVLSLIASDVVTSDDMEQDIVETYRNALADLLAVPGLARAIAMGYADPDPDLLPVYLESVFLDDQIEHSLVRYAVKRNPEASDAVLSRIRNQLAPERIEVIEKNLISK